ncbi:MAG: peptide ABC transporter permease [Anaerolineaceae bacterium 4572_32.2]|nr:MAG: peptide ABC transporter permease [Anaerolineaceae bacterium 4572_32.2]RLC76768.1 MAG: ABC transporter permease [Chloroflexota bacterium]HEY72640.1 ABC transporter permease [Thermoflexia bacterium]
MAHVAKVDAEIGLLARFLQGRKWYGVEWYMTVIGGFIVVFIVVLTLLTFFTPRLAPYDPEGMVGDPFTPPSTQHIFGTDQLGRDIFSRIIYGAQLVLQVALLSAVFSLVVGVPLGLLSGFLGGRLDRSLSLLMDSIYAFPGLILAIALAALLGAGVLNMSIAIAVVYVPIFFRLVRGQVLSIKEELYVEAAQSLGARGRTVLWRYIFPNVIPSIVVVFSLNIADAIITEAALAFIGLGVDPSRPDWGYDIYRGRSELVGGRWWPVTFPGLAIALVALGFSLFGEGLSEILNPRLTET